MGNEFAEQYAEKLLSHDVWVWLGPIQVPDPHIEWQSYGRGFSFIKSPPISIKNNAMHPSFPQFTTEVLLRSSCTHTRYTYHLQWNNRPVQMLI